MFVELLMIQQRKNIMLIIPLYMMNLIWYKTPLIPMPGILPSDPLVPKNKKVKLN